MHARNDKRVPFAEGHLVAQSIPNAEFVPLEGNNHLLLQQQPAWRQSPLTRRRGSSARMGRAIRRNGVSRTDCARTRGARPDRARSGQSADREVADTEREDRPQSHQQHFRQARHAKPRAGDCACTRSRAGISGCPPETNRPGSWAPNPIDFVYNRVTVWVRRSATNAQYS